MVTLTAPTLQAAWPSRLRLNQAAPKKTVLLFHKGSRSSNTIRTVLQEAGYGVIAPRTVEEALQIWPQLHSPLDLFLADVSYEADPDVRRFIEMLRAENPRIRVLFVKDLEQGQSRMLRGSQIGHQQLLTVVSNCVA